MEALPTRPSPAVADARAAAKRTRKQVSRACDWCRARRIGCDNGQPCRACRQRGEECTHKGLDEPRTLPQALREIDRLKARVRELETELETAKDGRQLSPPVKASSSTPEFDILRPKTDRHQLPSPETSCSASSQISSPPAFEAASKPQWEGIHVATAKSEQTSYYGPSSLFFFVSRMGVFLGKALQQPCSDRSMQPRAALHNTDMGSGEDDTSASAKTSLQVAEAAGSKENSQALGRAQEEAFLRLFWEGYHCLWPVVDEVDFRRHYASLWEPSRSQRKPSPLVDIILALCLQYGFNFIPRPKGADESPGAGADSEDASVAGRWYYRRAQALLTADLESPSITTVQCYVFSALYLCCASFQNMCHIMTAHAIRTAQILGLHLEPPEEMPRGERELRKRVWWLLWTVDARVSCKHGRPFMVDRSQVTVTLPSDDLEAATCNGGSLGSWGDDLTWLSFALHVQKMWLATVDIHESLFTKFGVVMEKNRVSSPYSDPETLETCAKYLSSKLPAMRQWADQVPLGLRLPRRNGAGGGSTMGAPFTPDRTPAYVDTLVPNWLQTQRFCLELLHHMMIFNLTRPFITFPSAPGASAAGGDPSTAYTPVADRLATMCVDHAVSFILVMHQAITETDLMSGWSEYFTLTWLATITAVGFLFAYPVHPATARTKHALDKAIEIFESYGDSFPVTGNAAIVMRDLMFKADILAGRMSSAVSPTLANSKEQQAPAAQQHHHQQQPVGGPALQTAPLPPLPPLPQPPPQGQSLCPIPATAPPQQTGYANIGHGQGMAPPPPPPPPVGAATTGDELAWFDPTMQADTGQFGQFMDWALSVEAYNNFDRFFDGSNPVDPWAFGPS